MREVIAAEFTPVRALRRASALTVYGTRAPILSSVDFNVNL